MGSSQLQRTLQNYADSAEVGFEFEVIVDGKQFAGAADLSGRTEDISRIDDYEELSIYFDVDSLRYRKQIKRDYGEWESDNGGDMDEWIEDEFGGMEDFVINYDIEPIHGWVTEPEHGEFYVEKPENVAAPERVFDAVRADLEQYDGIKDYLWKVEEDTSINGYGETMVGVEIVTNPIPLSEVPTTLKYYLGWISRNAETNYTTGLHINVSIDGMEEEDSNMDWVKVGLFLGERYVLELFNRINNTHAGEQLEVLRDFITGGGLNEKKFDEVVKVLNSAVSREKYRTFNISKDGYVEFRASGGEGYHRNIDRILNTTLRYIRVLGLGLDKNAARKEYMKKVAKLIDDANIGVGSGTDPESDLSKLFKRFVGSREPKVEDMPEVLYNVYMNNIKLSSGMQKSLRRMARQNKITMQKFKNFSYDYEIVPKNDERYEPFFKFVQKVLAVK